jgi:hypothetical protein
MILYNHNESLFIIINSSTYAARIFPTNVNPINKDAKPVFDFVSSATDRITVTNKNVIKNSIIKPYKNQFFNHHHLS